ncbi:ATP-dependent DNA helicase [Pectinatus haikarae]|uniref:ATP-dependent exoDNAse (Exonuclease V) alpha subunit n=2 Tax=Pectinatus haikarae TaxID=349096 RepID=A0ABT9Y741_9FIRM|nr:ATP-dependent RecD-like DNA helicase [Pectinatus haikarae]MDQ0203633.1 ATP-dependent exoDNAse (exonuclease V) alpha subunit [Pectinatus haikarae]
MKLLYMPLKNLSSFIVAYSSNECKRNFTVNDKIIFFKNDYKLGVMNGQTGKIIDIKDNLLTIKSNDQNIEINVGNYNHFDHGYAMTTHKAQGITANKVIINMDSLQKQLNSRNNYYVDISRARNEVSIYTNSKCKIDQQVSLFARKLSLNNFKRKDDSLKVKILRKIDCENELYLSIKKLVRKIDDVNKIKIR